MTIQEILQSSAKLLRKTSDTARLDAEILLAYTLKRDRSGLLMRSKEQLTENQIKTFRKLLAERKKGKPIAYITKTKEFYRRPFSVDESVLIPRPETEELCDLVIEKLKKRRDIRTIWDVGTGSGCIAITLALELPGKKLIASDVSKSALRLAKKNAKKLCPKSGIHFLESNLLQKISKKLAKEKAPLALVANLPYIGRKVNNTVDRNVKRFEPHLALYAGATGLELYKKLFDQIKPWNIRFLALEISPGLESITELVPRDYRLQLIKDLSGKTRFAVLEK